MPQFKPLPAIVLSCFSAALYRDVFLRWQGLGLNYLLILNLVMITPVVVFFVLDVQRSILTPNGQLQPKVQMLVDEVIGQLPELRFEKGEMEADAQQPYVIHVTAQEGRIPFAIIDENAGLSALQKSEAFLLLTRDAVYARTGPDRYETQLWSEIGSDSLVIDQRVATAYVSESVAWAAANKSWLMLLFGVLMWVGTLLVMFLYRAVQALLFGGVALIIANAIQVTLRYTDAVRLSAVALTPPVLADAFFGLVLNDQMHLLLFVMITLGYLAFALKNIKMHAL